jgi:hypothetical protein
LTKFAAPLLLSVGVFSAGSAESVSQPTCCIKNAYCCQTHEACCTHGTSVEATTGALTRAAADVPECCVEHAACCIAAEPCCAGSAANVQPAATETLTGSSDPACCAAGAACCPGECCSANAEKTSA